MRITELGAVCVLLSCVRLFATPCTLSVCVCVCVCESLSHVQFFLSPWIRFLCPWNFPGKNTRVDCRFLLQGIFPAQGSNPGLQHCRQILYHLSHQESLVLNVC